jgi:alanine dehydrogenase
MPSTSAVRAHGLIDGAGGSGAGAVSARNCSIAATTAAASASDAPPESISIRGRGGRRSPFVLIAIGTLTCARMALVRVLDGQTVFGAVPASEAVGRVREAFLRHHAGDWSMPAKVYVDAPPNGDFRAMPARGGGLATLKWVTSFPANPDRGLPVVTGALLMSDAATGELVAIADCAAVTSLRTGAAAAVSAQALAADGARSVGLIGCGVNGTWAARCLAACGFGPGVCHDPRHEAARALATELGWSVGDRQEAAAQEIVVTVTPGDAPVIGEGDLRPGQHIAVLGADAHGKAEVELDVLRRARLFCDEWEQASRGGELANGVSRSVVARSHVTELGAVLAGDAPGRQTAEEVTLFDSTGLAIQDLAIAHALLDALRSGSVDGPEIVL